MSLGQISILCEWWDAHFWCYRCFLEAENRFVEEISTSFKAFFSETWFPIWNFFIFIGLKLIIEENITNLRHIYKSSHSLLDDFKWVSILMNRSLLEHEDYLHFQLLPKNLSLKFIVFYSIWIHGKPSIYAAYIAAACVLTF